ncbi:MAG TPA: hypothetical protein VK886_03750 [Vicinamibacterales bacterium]|nr:hypothetical protein [Vicinamibacterales bacterium]
MRALRALRIALMLAPVLAAGATSVAGQETQPLDPKDFQSNSLLFVQQDVLPSFGQQEGVRLGTVRGLVSGAITTNFFFTIPPPGPFVADDWALVIDADGDQILFEIHAEGNATFDTLSPSPNFPEGINPFRAPFRATYKVVDATGKLAKYKGLTFPARGTGVVSTKWFVGNFSGAPVGIVYVEVSRNPIRK